MRLHRAALLGPYLELALPEREREQLLLQLCQLSGHRLAVRPVLPAKRQSMC